MNSGFQVLNLSLCEGTFYSGFQSLVRFQVSRAVFRIPKPRIPNFTSKIFQSSDSTSKNLPDFCLPYMERLGNVILSRLIAKHFVIELAPRIQIKNKDFGALSTTRILFFQVVILFITSFFLT